MTRKDEAGTRRLRYRLDYKNDSLDVICEFDRDGKIAALGTSW